MAMKTSQRHQPLSLVVQRPAMFGLTFLILLLSNCCIIVRGQNFTNSSFAPSTLDPTPAPSVVPVTPSPTAVPVPATPVPTATQPEVSSAPSTSPPEVSASPTTAVPVVTMAPTTANVTSTNPTGNSNMPSDGPSLAPTGQSANPTNPSNMPTATSVTETVYGLKMQLLGVSDDLDDEAKDALARAIETFTTKYHVELGVREVLNTTVDIKDAVLENVRRLLVQRPLQHNRRENGSRLRRMQEDPYVTVVYHQEFTFRQSSFVVTTAEGLATQPFEQPAFREEFVMMLKNSGVDPFDDLTGISPVTVGGSGGPTPTNPPSAPTPSPVSPAGGGDGGDDNDNDLFLPVPAIIGIALGGAGILIVCCVIYLYSASRKDENAYSSGGLGDEPPDNVKVGSKSDDVSQLPDPHHRMDATGGDSLAYGDQSVATVDYDYSKAYGGGGDTSVSSAGGTFGSNAGGMSTLDPNSAARTGASALGGGMAGASFSDGESFEGHFRDPGAGAAVKEELIDIFAPPGKLGVVIDTPDDGAPVVHAVKDSSVIADKIQVGDKLVAVDDEDVRSMTAIKVSKLISRKSANPTRKLSIVRTTVAD